MRLGCQRLKARRSIEFLYFEMRPLSAGEPWALSDSKGQETERNRQRKDEGLCERAAVLPSQPSCRDKMLQNLCFIIVFFETTRVGRIEWRRVKSRDTYTAAEVREYWKSTAPEHRHSMDTCYTFWDGRDDGIIQRSLTHSCFWNLATSAGWRLDQYPLATNVNHRQSGVYRFCVTGCCSRSTYGGSGIVEVEKLR
jgi:hypothetical protein